MSLGQKIAPYLPYLRRFARALTGDQPSGDAYVEAVLEALIADPAMFDQNRSARAELYRILVTIWDSVSVNQVSETRLSAHERRLDSLVPRARQAFLLTTVEGFDRSEVADILGTDAAGVGALIDEASRAMAEQVATTVLIIEDEPLIAMDLEALVEGLGHQVSSVARTHSEAVAAARATKPGLVLADIQLADGSSGLEAVNEILEGFSVPVIFITAYPERLLTGERPEPAFLITKPFDTDMVKAVISQALFFDRRAGPRSRERATA